MDGLDEDAVDRGAEQNQDSVEAGMMETDSYDREQLVNDGVVMDGVIYNPDVEANAEIYRTFNFLESGNGLYISSLNSGLLYYNGETKEVSRVMNYPVFRLWELSDGRYMAVGFDDNSKRYVPSDMAFAKCFRFEDVYKRQITSCPGVWRSTKRAGVEKRRNLPSYPSNARSSAP